MVREVAVERKFVVIEGPCDLWRTLRMWIMERSDV